MLLVAIFSANSALILSLTLVYTIVSLLVNTLEYKRGMSLFKS